MIRPQRSAAPSEFTLNISPRLQVDFRGDI
jgi:hypothetical protein